MKIRLSLLFLLVLGLCLTGFAQSDQQQPPQQGERGMGPGHGGPPSPDQQLARMTKELNLTSDQQAKIKPILEDTDKQMQALRSDTSLSREDRFSKMQEIHKTSNTQISEILTADQKTKFESMMNRRRGPGGPGGPGGGAPPQQPQQ